MRIFQVQRASDSVKRDGLVQELIVRRTLKLNDNVIPGVALRFAGNACRHPSSIHIVPDRPDLAANQLAFGAEHEAHIVKKLSDIELNVLGGSKVGAIKVRVVGEVVKWGNQDVIRIQQSLRRTITDKMVVPQNVGVRRGPADKEFCRLAGE